MPTLQQFNQEEEKRNLKHDFYKAWHDNFIKGNGPYWPDQDMIFDWWIEKLASHDARRDDSIRKIIEKAEPDPRVLYDEDYIKGYNAAVYEILNLLK